MSAIPLHFHPLADGEKDPSHCWAPLVFQQVLMASVWCSCGQRLTIPAAHISREGVIQFCVASCGHGLDGVALMGWNPNHIGDGA